MKIMHTTPTYSWFLGIVATILSFAVFFPMVALASSPTVTTNGAVIQSGTSVTLTGFVDPKNLRTTYWFELGKESGSFPTVYPSKSATMERTVEQSLYNVTRGHTYYFRLVAQNKDGRVYGDTVSFNTGSGSSSSSSNTSGSSSTVINNGTGGTVTIVNSGSSSYRGPSLITSFATNVTDGSFTMNGFIDPSGGTSVYRWFEWGDTESLGNTSGYTAISSAPVNFSHTITGLQPNRTYYFRAMGRNQYGVSSGNIYSVKTAQYGTGASTGGGVAPIVVAQQGSALSNTSIQMNGMVVPGSTTLVSAYFEWGASQNLGNATPVQSINPAQATKISHTLTNLSTNTTYYYRVVGQDSANRTYRSGITSITTSFGGAGSVVAGTSGSGAGAQGSAAGSKVTSSSSKDSGKSTSGSATAGVLFSKTASGLIGWFLAIIFFIISVVLGIMLKARGKDEEKKEAGFPEFPVEFHPQNIK